LALDWSGADVIWPGLPPSSSVDIRGSPLGRVLSTSLFTCSSAVRREVLFDGCALYQFCPATFDTSTTTTSPGLCLIPIEPTTLCIVSIGRTAAPTRRLRSSCASTPILEVWAGGTLHQGDDVEGPAPIGRLEDLLARPRRRPQHRCPAHPREEALQPAHPHPPRHLRCGPTSSSRRGLWPQRSQRRRSMRTGACDWWGVWPVPDVSGPDPDRMDVLEARMDRGMDYTG
jgi:hypothetical protein